MSSTPRSCKSLMFSRTCAKEQEHFTGCSVSGVKSIASSGRLNGLAATCWRTGIERASFKRHGRSFARSFRVLIDGSRERR